MRNDESNPFGVPAVCRCGCFVLLPWSESAGEEIQVMAIQPPGREWRLMEEPYRDMTAAADGLLPEIVKEQPEKRPAR